MTARDETLAQLRARCRAGQRTLGDVNRNAALWVASRIGTAARESAFGFLDTPDVDLGRLTETPYLAAIGFAWASGETLKAYRAQLIEALSDVLQRSAHTLEGAGVGDDPLWLAGIRLLAHVVDDDRKANLVDRVVAGSDRLREGGTSSAFVLALGTELAPSPGNSTCQAIAELIATRAHRQSLSADLVREVEDEARRARSGLDLMLAVAVLERVAELEIGNASVVRRALGAPGQENVGMHHLFTATVTVIKTGGVRFEGLKATVDTKQVLLLDTSVPIDPEDVIERTVPSGTERYVVISAQYLEAFGGLPAHTQIAVRRSAGQVARRVQAPPQQVQSAETPQTVDLAVITILEVEYKAVLACLDSHHHLPGTKKPNRFAWRRGTVRVGGGEYVVVVALAGDPTTSVGALCTKATIDEFEPRYVVVAGVAGGFPAEELTHGDVVVSKTILAYEYGKIDGGTFQPRNDFSYRVHRGLVNAARGLIAAGADWWTDIKSVPPRELARAPIARVGLVASGDKVVDEVTDAFFGQVMKVWPKILAVEMEGAGAAAAIEEAQDEGKAVTMLMVRGICDMPGSVDGKGTKERDAWKAFAAEAAAKFLFSLLRDQWPLGPLNAARSTPAEAAPADAFALIVDSNAARDRLCDDLLAFSQDVRESASDLSWWSARGESQLGEFQERLRDTVALLQRAHRAEDVRRAWGIFEGRAGVALYEVSNEQDPHEAGAAELAEAIEKLAAALRAVEFEQAPVLSTSKPRSARDDARDAADLIALQKIAPLVTELLEKFDFYLRVRKEDPDGMDRRSIFSGFEEPIARLSNVWREHELAITSADVKAAFRSAALGSHCERLLAYEKARAQAVSAGKSSDEANISMDATVKDMREFALRLQSALRLAHRK